MDRLIGMETLDLPDPVDLCVLTVIDDEFHKRKRLKQCHSAFCGFVPDSIHDVALQTELIREYGYDYRRLAVSGKPEYNSFGLEQHQL